MQVILFVCVYVHSHAHLSVTKEFHAVKLVARHAWLQIALEANDIPAHTIVNPSHMHMTAPLFAFTETY